jgi:2-dehydro-3-deoxygluconokinase
MTKVACIGECMIELKQAQGGLYSRGYGGDTLNTANYLARLGADVDYITALGDDPMSEEMLAGWAAEGVGTSQVLRLPGKLPGIYMIQTDDAGERRFFHWRENSAARSLMDRPETGDVLRSLASYDLVYLSAITLSLYGESGRRQLIAALRSAREAGARVAFDTNFRIRGWPDLDIARAVYRDAFEAADIVLASTEDLLPLYAGESNDRLMARIPSPEVVLKLSVPASIVRLEDSSHEVKAEPVTKPVVDTTAAGDSFAAAYIFARLVGAEPVEAARTGHRVAGA